MISIDCPKAYRYYFMVWLNDFITVDSFAEYYGIPVKRARRILLKGRVLHQDKFGHH